MPDASDLIELSVSHHFYNKENCAPMRPNRSGELSNLWAFGAYERVKWTPAQITEHITSGKSIAVGVYKNNWCREDNFISAQLMGIDFDDNQDVTTLLRDKFVDDYAYLIYPTPSSTPANPRSRVLFILDQPIEDVGQYRKRLRRLLQRFQIANADEQCKDAARRFYGSTQKGHSAVDCARLPVTVLESLPKHPDEDRPANIIEPAFITSVMDSELYKPYIDKALEEEFRGLMTTGEHRNNALYVTSRAVGELVSAPWSGLSRSSVEHDLYTAAQANGYIAKDGEHAARATIRSGIEAGMAEPRPQPTNIRTLNAPTVQPPTLTVVPPVNGVAPAKTRDARPPLPTLAALSDAQMTEAANGRKWLDTYVEWATQASPLTPRLFHEGIGLWLLASVSTRRMCVHIGGEFIYPNLYLLIIARTTIYRKSTAMKLAKQVLAKANLTSLLLPAEATPEALFDELAGIKPPNFETLPEDARKRWMMGRAVAAQRSFFKDEVSSLFASFKKDYMAGLHEIFLQGYDADVDQLDKRLKSLGIVTVKKPCLSFLGATTPGMFGKYVGTEEHESGLLPRFAILTPDADLPYRDPADELAEPTMLVEQLKRMFMDALPWHGETRPTAPAEFAEVQPPDVMTVGFAPEAFDQLKRYRRVMGFDFVHNETITDIQAAFYARLGTMAYKVAMLLAAVETGQRGFRIEARHAYAAQQICETWRESLHRLEGDVNKAKGGDSDDNKVLGYIRQSGIKGVTLREIMQFCNLRPRAKAVEALTILADDGLIEKYDYKPEGRGRPTQYYRMIGLVQSTGSK